MGTRTKSREHQLSAEIEVRPARAGDESALSKLEFVSKGSDAILVGDRGGEIVGALGVAPRPFETEILKRKTMHIDVIASPDETVLAPLLSGASKFLFAQGCRLLTSRRPAGDESIHALQAAGFRLIERLVTLMRPLPMDRQPLPDGVSVAKAADAEGCAKVAAEAFTFDRFHADPNIEDTAASALKAQWARNSVNGRADCVFVTLDDNVITGFNACLLRGDTAIIDLIGVAPGHQGRGFGRALVAAAIAHYSGKAARMTVGTQDCNVASLSLYNALGFRPSSTAVTLHAHA